MVNKTEETLVDKEEEEMIEETIPEDVKPELIEIDEIKGVGHGTVVKLNEMGIRDICDLAIASAIEIHEKLASQKYTLAACEGLVIYANDYLTKAGVLNNPIVTSKKLLQADLERKRFSTGDEMYDKWFGGGIESMAVTEIYGRYKSGKTQTCDCVAVTTAASGKKVLFIDTENSYSPVRINEIAVRKGLDNEMVLENILVMKPKTASMLYLYIKELTRHIREYNIELVIVDSIIALHRAEFIGRQNLAGRQQQLARIMSYLVRCAENYDIGVIITNQVLESPDPFRPGTFATGGNIVSHASTHRVLLRAKTPVKETNYRSFSTAIMEDSPRYARTEQIIELGTYGVRGIDPSKPLPKE